MSIAFTAPFATGPPRCPPRCPVSPSCHYIPYSLLRIFRWLRRTGEEARCRLLDEFALRLGTTGGGGTSATLGVLTTWAGIGVGKGSGEPLG
jgi:hypothetical protein